MSVCCTVNQYAIQFLHKYHPTLHELTLIQREREFCEENLIKFALLNQVQIL